jgi:hypothetical protein
MNFTIPSLGAPAPVEATATEEEILSAAGRILASRRRQHRGPSKIRPCPRCGATLNARQRRQPCACGHKFRRGE